MREQAKALSEAERERRRQEKKQAKEAQKADAAAAREGKKKNQKEVEEEEKTKKTKTKSVKTVDTEGFVTLDTEYTKLNEDGQKIEIIKASNKKKEDDKESEKKKKPTVSASPTLQNNPFAQIKHAGGVQSPQEVQAKINAKKGEQRNLENNEMQQKEKKKPAPIPIQPKKQKEKKPKKDPAENSSEETAIVPVTHQSSVAMNPQPYIMVAFGVALAVVGYVFMLG